MVYDIRKGSIFSQTVLLNFLFFLPPPKKGQCEKISHPVSFPSRLAIDNRWFAPNVMVHFLSFPPPPFFPLNPPLPLPFPPKKKLNSPMNYDLVAAVSHHGLMAGKGHYTCAARHQSKSKPTYFLFCFLFICFFLEYLFIDTTFSQKIIIIIIK